MGNFDEHHWGSSVSVITGWCAGCPILRECAAAAESETFGVWGAVDVTLLTTKRKRVQALTETSTTQPKENHAPVR